MVFSILMWIIFTVVAAYTAATIFIIVFGSGMLFGISRSRKEFRNLTLEVLKIMEIRYFWFHFLGTKWYGPRAFMLATMDVVIAQRRPNPVDDDDVINWAMGDDGENDLPAPPHVIDLGA